MDILHLFFVFYSFIMVIATYACMRLQYTQILQKKGVTCFYMEEYIAVRLKELCKAQHMSKYRLAQLTGLSQTTIANLMDGKNSPTVQTLDIICKAFGISVSQFFNPEDAFSGLSDVQKELLTAWAALDDEKRKLLLAFMQSLQQGQPLEETVHFMQMTVSFL